MRVRALYKSAAVHKKWEFCSDAEYRDLKHGMLKARFPDQFSTHVQPVNPWVLSPASRFLNRRNDNCERNDGDRTRKNPRRNRRPCVHSLCHSWSHIYRVCYTSLHRKSA